jgi:CRISPR-associated endonuclease/helicase Cas3
MALQRGRNLIAHIRKIGNKTEEESVLEHNLKVAEYAARLGESAGMSEIAYLTGYFHDIGKFTRKFYLYINNSCKNGKDSKGPAHSTAGGKYIYDHYDDRNGMRKLTATVAAWSVFSHHGINDMVTEDGDYKFKDRLDNINVEDYEEAVENYNQSNRCDTDECFEKAVCEMRELTKKISEQAKGDIKNANKMNSFYLGLLARLNLSILIEADRTKTAEFMLGQVLEDFTVPNWSELTERMDGYLRRLSANTSNNTQKQRDINAARSEYSRLCSKAAEKDTGIYRLDMPTGAGKTMASLKFALKHADVRKKKRIFYIAPYKSILTQNAQKYRDIFGDCGIILEHHSDIVAENDTDDKTVNYHTENWRNGIVITTMVQFLNTLFGGKTQQIRRFQALTDAVIIIDEVQSIPVKCTYMFNAAMNFLKAFNTTVVLCSATQPAFNEAKIPINLDGSLINENASVRMNFKRNEIVDLRDNVTNCHEIAEYASCLIENSDSGIIILNTKRATLAVYDELKNVSCENVKVFHISTNMCPAHQKKVIAEFEKCLKEKGTKVICVSTTVLEAGVDISAQWVMRSLSGWDSVLQSAGRCNRSGEYDGGYVYVVECSEENISKMGDVVCGKECSKNALRAYADNKIDGDMSSKEFIKYYYERFLHERENNMNYPIGEDMNLFDLLSLNEKFTNYAKERNQGVQIGILTQAFKKAGDTFEVIKNDTKAIVVPYGEGKNIIAELASMSVQENPNRLLRKAQAYTVNLYSDKIKNFEKSELIYKLENVGVYCLKDGFYDDCVGISEQTTLDDLFY